jgi:phage shock protein A
MTGTPISSCFYVMNGDAQMKGYQDQINQLTADAAKNPDHAQLDQEQIQYYEQLEETLSQEESIAAAYRKSNNDPTLAKQLNLLEAKHQTVSQLIGLDQYIQKLKDDMKKNPQNQAADEEKIENAEQQKQVIQQFEQAYEAYQNSNSQDDAAKLNALIAELQKLRTENPDSPYASGPIFEDFQQVVNGYTVFSFNGHQYAVG